MKCFSGESRIRTCEDVISGFTVRPRWPLEYLPNFLNLNNLKNLFQIAFGIKKEPAEGLEPTTC